MYIEHLKKELLTKCKRFINEDVTDFIAHALLTKKDKKQNH